MNDHQDLIDRLGELTAVAVAGTDAPPFDRHAHRSRSRAVRHPRRWIAGIVVGALAVAGVVVWAPTGDDGERIDTAHTTTTATEVVDDSTFPRLLPTQWPAGFEGETETRSPVESLQRDAVARHLLAREGSAAAVAAVTDSPFDGGSPDRGIVVTPTSIDGHPAQWSEGNGRLGLHLALEPGRSLFVSSRTASHDELQALSLAYDAERLAFDPDSLPESWTVEPDTAELSWVLDAGMVPPSWASARRVRPESSGEPPTTSLAVGAIRTPDAAAVVEQLAALNSSVAEAVDVGGAPAVLLTGSGPAPGGLVVVWAPSPDVVAGVWTRDVDRVATLELAASVREVDSSVWDALEPGPAEPARIVDGFALVRADEEVVASGEAFDHRWLVTSSVWQRPGSTATGPGAGGAPELMSMTSLYLIGPDGQQLHGGGLGGGGGPRNGVGYSLTGRHHAFHAEIPPEVQDPQIVLHGAPRDVVDVGVLGEGRIIFALIEARSTPKFEGGDVYVTGTMPDGSAFRSPAAPTIELPS